MKGIFVLTFHKKPGAFVDREYPKGITQDLGIDETDQNKIYSLHRMRNTRPNYLFLKAKNITIASFFSGFDLKQYVGRPNQCVSVILDQNENPTIWEGQLRRITHDILPVLAEIRGDEIIMTGLSSESKYRRFDEILAQQLAALQAGQVQPMEDWEGEVRVGTGTVIDTINSGSEIRDKLVGTKPKELSLTADDILKATELAKNEGQPSGSSSVKSAFTPAPTSAMAASASTDPMVQAAQQMELMEKEGMRKEIRRLSELVKEKTERIKALESQVREASASSIGDAEKNALAKIKGEYEALLASKEQELENWCAKVSELNENNFINQDTIAKMTEMTMMQTEEMQAQSRQIAELKTKIKMLEANQNAPSDLTAENVKSLQSHLVEVEETLKATLKDLDQKKEQNKELFKQISNMEAQKEKMTLEVADLEQHLKKATGTILEHEETINQLKKSLGEVRAQLSQAEQKIEALTITAEALESAAEEASVSESNPVEANVKSVALEDENKRLAKELEALQNELISVKNHLNNPANSVTESEIKKLQQTVAQMQNELIDAKKTVKIQRREIEHLQKLAGLQ